MSFFPPALYTHVHLCNALNELFDKMTSRSRIGITPELLTLTSNRALFNTFIEHMNKLLLGMHLTQLRLIL